MAVEEVYRRPEDYDLETGARDIGDTPFWEGLLRRERPVRALEVGAGSGRLTLPLARLAAAQGFHLTGLEMEPAMLARARERAAQEPPATRRALTLALGDARDLDHALGARERTAPFDVILMPYGVAHHLTTLDDQLAAWRGARRWLASGGLLAVDVTAPNLSELREGQRGATPRRPDMDARGEDGRRLRRSVSVRYDAARQEATLAYEYDVTDPCGARRHYRSDFVEHVFFPRELALLFQISGFALERLVGSYAGDPFGNDSGLLIGLGRAV